MRTWKSNKSLKKPVIITANIPEIDSCQSMIFIVEKP